MKGGSWFGGIQCAWRVVPIKRVARLGTGHTPDRSNPALWEDCTVPWVTVADIQRLPGAGLRPLMETEQHVSELGVRHSAAVIHPAGTVMLSRTASIGYSCLIGRPMATTQAFVTWTPSELVDSRYLLLAVRALAPELDRLAYGSTHKTIYMPDISTLMMPLPPLDEQRMIADFLDAETTRIDALIAKKRRMIGLIFERWASFLHEILGALDREPTVVRRVAILTAGGTPSVDDTDCWDDAGCPWVSIGDMSSVRQVIATQRGLTPLGIARARLHVGQAGTVLFAMYASVGAVSRLGVDACWNQAILGINGVSGLADNDFLEFWLMHIRPTLEGIVRANTQSNLNAEQVGALPFPAIDVGEQVALAARMRRMRDRLDKLVRNMGRQIELLQERRQALITYAVTGQLPIPV